jgi:prepilin-type N-terminal cleavage/methylation domain-containing protein/prepilin-type processing-associated H-X9-DG protein
MERSAPCTGPSERPCRARSTGRRSAFTLLEILISVTIIAVLLAILFPALRFSIRAARGFRCQVSLRSVAFDFGVFADDQLHGDRGNDPRDLGSTRRFRLETFQESQYGIDEFWRWPTTPTHTLPDAEKNDPMRCPEVRGEITLRNNTPCSQGAITPARNISFGFNMRLHRAEISSPSGPSMLAPVTLTSDIALHGRVPLAWDVDGSASGSASPVFSAPSLASAGPYANNRYWFPALRHNGAVNVAFIDGSVVASTHPLQEPAWDWSYQPVH